MQIKIGINGFGRIGKNIWQLLLKDKQMVVKEINHPDLLLEQFIYLAENDTVFSNQDSEYKIENDSINVKNKYKEWFVKLHSKLKPEDIEWDVDVVIDCTGKFKKYGELSGHLKNNVKLVVLTAPASDDMPVIINGFNNNDVDGKIISCGSCTTNCIVPVINSINRACKILSCYFLTVHAVTPSQSISDRKNIKQFRLGRNAYQNIIPTTTGANSLVKKMFPELDGKVIGSSCRVPVDNGSYVEIVFTLSEEVEKKWIIDKLCLDFIKVTNNKNVSRITKSQKSQLVAIPAIY